jgi:DNA transposition AAA+ family ATPase
MKTEILTRPVPDVGLQERLRMFQSSTLNKNKVPGLSLADLGDRFGYSPTTISKYLSDTFDGNLARLEQVLRDGLRQATERAHKISGLFSTPAEEKIRKTCYRLINEGWIGSLYGDGGIGKTLGTYPYLFENLGAVFVTLVFAKTSVGALTNVIYQQVKKPEEADYCKENETKWDYLVRVFKNSGRILIFDQAHLLRHGGRQFICDLNDATGLGSCLSATRLCSATGANNRSKAAD